MSRPRSPLARSRRTALIAALLLLSVAACRSETGDEPPSTTGAAATPTVVARGGSAPAADVAVAPRRTGGANALRSPEYGIQAFLWWRPEVAEQDLLLAKDLGFTWVKQMFAWRDVQPEPNRFDWTKPDFIVDTAVRYGGIDLLIRLDYQPEWARAGCTDQGPPTDPALFAAYAGAVAARYRGNIGAYQIWNEPNLAREWCDQPPSPTEYARLLAAAYAAIKAADPDALVISAGLSPTGSGLPVAMPDDVYLDALYTAMGDTSAGYFDILGVHAAGFAAPPETSPEEAAANPAYGSERFFTFRRVEDLRAIQERHGDGGTRVAVLEMGWTSDSVHPEYAWHAVSEETKADYLVRAYQYAAEHWSPWISIMSAIYLCSTDWTPADEQYWWCIDNPDGTPRPAFLALKAMPK